MANLLIESMADDDFDFTQYKDTYNERLQQLIDAKISGKEIVTPPNEALPHVPDLLDALRQSLETSKPAKKKPARLAPPTKPAGGADRQTTQDIVTERAAALCSTYSWARRRPPTPSTLWRRCFSFPPNACGLGCGLD